MRTSPEPGAARAERRYGPEEPAFKGHFPRTKILPGVKLIEFALDTAEDGLRREGRRPRLARVESAKFLAPVFPGYTVSCECRFAEEEGAWSARATLAHEGSVCATVKALFREEG